MKHNFLRYSFLLISFIFLPAAVSAQSFVASVDRNPVGVNERFQVTFSFSGGDINGVKNFKAPDFKNFYVLSGPNLSTNMQIINGAVSGSKSYSFYVQASNAGKYKIGSASVESGGNTYTTDIVTIEVQQGTPQQKNGKPDPYAEIGDNLFIRASADKLTLYKGEQVTVTYKLYTRLSIASQMSVSKLPQYQGFWAEELTAGQNIMFDTEVLNGKQYRVGLLKRVALFPSQTGELEVTPFEINVPVQVKKQKRTSGNAFDDFFNDPFFNQSEMVDYKAKSNTLKLKVLDLPSENVPASFNGAVGNYSISSSLDKKQTKTDEPISLKMEIKGSGNIKLLNVPTLNLPASFEQYEPKTDEDINRAGIVSGTKRIEYLLVPRSAGKFDIDPVEFSFFSPARKEFVTLKTDPYNIEVEQGKHEIGGFTSKEDVKMLGQDIRFIKLDEKLLNKRDGIVLYTAGFWAAVITPIFALSFLVGWKRRHDKLSGNLQLMRYQKAQKVSKLKLKNAKALMEANKPVEFYTEISQALFGYLEDKFKIPKAEFTLERASDELRQRKIDEKLIEQFKVCAEKCEFARFAPGQQEAVAMNDMYNQSADVIIELEKNFNGKRKV
ncbi:MAG: BatD family protein [Ignavibacteriaceae bacterium]|nr:BatD family protein [Ignavibacteriaceae bacterium]